MQAWCQALNILYGDKVMTRLKTIKRTVVVEEAPEVYKKKGKGKG